MENKEVSFDGGERASTSTSTHTLHENLENNNLLTTNEEFDSIKIYDSTVEVVGYVDGIEAPRIIGSKQQYKFFKFYLNNGTGRRIQVCAWNDDIDHIEQHIQSNFIVYLDGVQTRLPKMNNFNNGNVRYELLIKSSSIVSNLGKYEPLVSINIKPIRVELKEVFQNTFEHNIRRIYKNKFRSNTQ